MRQAGLPTLAIGLRINPYEYRCQNRRMSRDYERLCATGEAFIYVAMSRLMVRRLARS